MVNIFYKNYYMETLRKQSVFVLAAVLACTALHAQTADEVVNKYVAAIGGKSAIENVKSVYIESEVEVMGNTLPSNTWIINGKGFKSETDFNGAKIVNVITDKGGWMINPPMGVNTATALPDEQLKAMKGRMDIGGPLFDYAAKGGKIELAGQDSADYKIKLTNGSTTSTFFINKKTYLVDKALSNANMMGQDVQITMTFSDYRKLDGGFTFPFGQVVEQPNFTATLTHKKVEVNKSIDPSIFEMPK